MQTRVQFTESSPRTGDGPGQMGHLDESFTLHSLERLPHTGVSVLSHLLSKERQIMKRALIGSLSVLAIIVGTEAANAQADINPNIYPPYRGAPVAQQPWEWHSTPGPTRRGSQCVAEVD